MPELMPDQGPDGWNKSSAAYNANIWELMQPFVGEVIRRAEISPEHEALDVAAGTGAVTLAAAPLARGVMAIDFADRMIDHLR